MKIVLKQVKVVCVIWEKRMIYLTIGFFLISGKYNENDIFEPDFNDLTQLNDKIILQIDARKHVIWTSWPKTRLSIFLI